MLFGLQDLRNADPELRGGVRHLSASGDFVAVDVVVGPHVNAVAVYTESVGLRRLPVLEASLIDPRISPSGRRLLATQTSWGGAAGNVLVETDRTTPVRVDDLTRVGVGASDGSFRVQGSGLEWGQTDDELVAVFSDTTHADYPESPPSHIYAVDPVTLAPRRRLTETPLPTRPQALMPGGGGAAYNQDGSLWAVRPLGSAPRRVAASTEVVRSGWSRGGLFWYVDQRGANDGYDVTIHVFDESWSETTFGPFTYVGDVGFQ